MLDVLRRGASTWVSKLLLGLLIVSFGIWGIADVFRGFGSNTIVSVGGHEITAQDFDIALKRESDRLSQQYRRQFTREQLAAAGLPSQVLSQLVQDATLTEQARRAGVGVSNGRVADQIRQDPAFLVNGQFDRRQFFDLLRQNGWTEDQYVVTARDAAKRQQLVTGLAGGIVTPKVMLEATNQYLNEERKVSYMVLPPSILGTVEPPAEADLAKYYAEKKAAYKAPETRSFSVMVLDAAAITRPDDVTEDDIKREYERQKSRYTTVEQRAVERVSYEKPEDAAAAADRLAKGASFDDLVRESGLKPEDLVLGPSPKDGFLDPAVGDAAFALAKVGDVSAPVKGKFGTVILRLKELKPGGTQPLDAVKDEIRQALARAHAEDEVGQRRGQIEDALAGGAKLADIAARFGLKAITTGDVTREGKLADGSELKDIPEPVKLVKAAFESDVGVENEPMAVGTNGYIWYEVNSIKPAHDRTLDEVRAEVVANWTAEQTKIRLAARAVEATAAIEGGKAIEDVAKEAGVEVKTVEHLKRSPAPAELGPSATQVAFEGPEGHVGTANGPDDSRIVLKVDSVEQPVFFAEADDLKKPAESIASSIGDSLVDQYLRKSQTELMSSLNTAVLSRTLGPQGRN